MRKGVEEILEKNKEENAKELMTIIWEIWMEQMKDKEGIESFQNHNIERTIESHKAQL